MADDEGNPGILRENAGSDGSEGGEIDSSEEVTTRPAKSDRAPSRIARRNELAMVLFARASRTRADFIDERTIAERHANDPNAKTEMLVQSVPFWRPKKADPTVQGADKRQVQIWNKARRDEKTIAMEHEAYQTFAVLRGTLILHLSTYGCRDPNERAAKKLLSSLIKLAKKDSEWLGSLRTHHYRYDSEAGKANAHREGMNSAQEVATAVYHLQANNLEGKYAPGLRDYLNIDLRFRSAELVDDNVDFTETGDIEHHIANPDGGIVNPIEMWNARFLTLESATAKSLLEGSRAERIQLGIDMVTKTPHVIAGETWVALLVIAITPRHNLSKAAELVSLDLDQERYNQTIFVKLAEYQQQSSEGMTIFEVMRTFATLVRLLQRQEEVDQEGDGSGDDHDRHEPREGEDNSCVGQGRATYGPNKIHPDNTANSSGTSGKAPEGRQTRSKSKRNGSIRRHVVKGKFGNGATPISQSPSAAGDPIEEQIGCDDAWESEDSQMPDNGSGNCAAASPPEQNSEPTEYDMQYPIEDKSPPLSAWSSNSSCRALSDGLVSESVAVLAGSAQYPSLQAHDNSGIPFHDGVVQDANNDGDSIITPSPSASENRNEVQFFASPPERNHATDLCSDSADKDSEDSVDIDKTLVAEDISMPFSLKMIQDPARFKAEMRRRSCLLSPPVQRKKNRSSSEACLDDLETGPRKLVRMGSVAPDIGQRQLFPLSNSTALI